MMAADDAALWLRQGPYYWDGPGGTRISASLVGAGPEPGWRYSAWGAEECPELNYWQWRKQVASVSRAERGQALPQRRPMLGVYLTASEARGACLAWLAGQERGSDQGTAAPAGADDE